MAFMQYPLPTYTRSYAPAFCGVPPEEVERAIESWRRQLTREALTAPLEAWARRHVALRLEDLERVAPGVPLLEEFAEVEARARQHLAAVTRVREFAETAVTIVSLAISDRTPRFDVALVPAPTWSAEYRSGPLISSAYIDRRSRGETLAPPRRD